MQMTPIQYHASAPYDWPTMWVIYRQRRDRLREVVAYFQRCYAGQPARVALQASRLAQYEAALTRVEQAHIMRRSPDCKLNAAHHIEMVWLELRDVYELND
jgi:hypothetical protein